MPNYLIDEKKNLVEHQGSTSNLIKKTYKLTFNSEGTAVSPENYDSFKSDLKNSNLILANLRFPMFNGVNRLNIGGNGTNITSISARLSLAYVYPLLVFTFDIPMNDTYNVMFLEEPNTTEDVTRSILGQVGEGYVDIYLEA